MTIIDPNLAPTDRIVGEAIDNLGGFILDQAEQTTAHVGFGWIVTPDAPNTYEGVRRAYARSCLTGEPLPISGENSDDVIYTDPLVNVGLRFWHDVNHARRGLSFELVDELELSLWHLDQLELAGFPRGGLEWQLLHADLTGQTYVQAFARRFPVDQRQFVNSCVTASFDHGLLVELRRQL
ncbi:hypothetical protein [Antrihabitans spumae]|uniref:Uncharacterized protein n=1 Tax=Antrihabitans spumae TaxID=3373370 RepID=A0ABW7KPL1_9NOCA